MSGLTTEQHQKLIESIRQWGDSQTRIQAEQDHQSERVRICDKLANFIERGRTAPRDQWLDLERIIDHWPACHVVNLSDKDAGRK